jgi:hypothetical protein
MIDSKNCLQALSSGNLALSWSVFIISPPYFLEKILSQWIVRSGQTAAFFLVIGPIINPATKLVIPAAAERRAGIQKRPCDYWIPAFAGMTE